MREKQTAVPDFQHTYQDFSALPTYAPVKDVRFKVEGHAVRGWQGVRVAAGGEQVNRVNSNPNLDKAHESRNIGDKEHTFTSFTRSPDITEPTGDSVYLPSSTSVSPVVPD